MKDQKIETTAYLIIGLMFKVYKLCYVDSLTGKSCLPNSPNACVLAFDNKEDISTIKNDFISFGFKVEDISTPIPLISYSLKDNKRYYFRLSI